MLSADAAAMDCALAASVIARLIIDAKVKN
jgi:hypothetical protein